MPETAAKSHSISSRPLVAVVGAGIGGAHVEGYLGAGATVGAICDLNESKARLLATKFGIKPKFPTFDELVSDPTIEAVSLCTPNILHAPMAMQLLSAGKHVLCEKPLAINAIDAQKIADCARENGRICMVSQVLRFRTDVLELKKAAADIGEIYYARTMARRQNGIPKWGGWFTQSHLSGGGPLIDTGVHVLDLAWWLGGCPQPVSASGVTYAKFGPQRSHLGAGGAADENGSFDVEDLAAGFVRFENGLTIHFESSWAINADGDARFCDVHGTKGALIWNDAPKIIAADGTERALSIGAGTPWKSEMEHFLGCIERGETPDPDASQGVVMMQILDALYQSARENREISIGKLVI